MPIAFIRLAALAGMLFLNQMVRHPLQNQHGFQNTGIVNIDFPGKVKYVVRLKMFVDGLCQLFKLVFFLPTR